MNQNPWFRVYSGILNDPKILRMPEPLRWNWIATLCVASTNGGTLPHIEDCALMMRKTVEETEEIFSDLIARELIDEIGDGLFAPHNWKGRQYRSDVSTDRVKQHRKRLRNVSEAPPDTDTDTEANASDAAASAGVRLWSEGLPALLALGVKEKQARPMLGRWLRDCGDDHSRLLEIILSARGKCPAEPIGWITRMVKPKEAPNGKTASLTAVAGDLAASGVTFGPRPGSVRGGADETHVRLLSKGRCE